MRILAYYLPQFHPIPENDDWWGKGFTEWTNVKKAKPLFKGHQQPIEPGELGYYDLLQDEGIQEKQAKLAKEYGIDGFIYYQYWFGNGKMLLEKPAEKMLRDPKVDLPFCFCWANQTWQGIWHGLNKPGIIMEQLYPGREDYIKYFEYLLPFFKDKRYIKEGNMPVFHVFRIDDIPDLDIFMEVFNSMARKNGFEGIYFIATSNDNSNNILNREEIKGVVGLDFYIKLRYNHYFHFSESSPFFKIEYYWKKLTTKIFVEGEQQTKPLILNYEAGVKKMPVVIKHKKYIPCVLPNWDNSPRSGVKSLVLKNTHPGFFEKYLQRFISAYKQYPENPPFFIIKSWNEWAEGNYIEPDKTHGRGWLEAIKKVKVKTKIE